MADLNVNSIANEAGTGGPDFVGMPTVEGDPIVESGSNTDGYWVRWADGTQKVWAYVSASGWTEIQAYNEWYKIITFPIAFVDNQWSLSGAIKQFNGAVNRLISGTSEANGTITATGFALQQKLVDGATTVVSASYESTGRWK